MKVLHAALYNYTKQKIQTEIHIFIYFHLQKMLKTILVIKCSAGEKQIQLHMSRPQWSFTAKTTGSKWKNMS